MGTTNKSKFKGVQVETTYLVQVISVSQNNKTRYLVKITTYFTKKENEVTMAIKHDVMTSLGQVRRVAPAPVVVPPTPVAIGYLKSPKSKTRKDAALRVTNQNTGKTFNIGYFDANGAFHLTSGNGASGLATDRQGYVQVIRD